MNPGAAPGAMMRISACSRHPLWGQISNFNFDDSKIEI
jgi:hypothetical protein